MSKEQIKEMAAYLFKFAPILSENNCHYVAEQAYKDGYRKQEWISVDERLPESGVLCLMCCDVKRYDGTHRQYICDGFHAERFKEKCYFTDGECATEYNEETDEYYLEEGWYEEINNWDEYSSIAINDTVTHWMPLPEPPKMKGGAE
jgi:hypothetical protein